MTEKKKDSLWRVQVSSGFYETIEASACTVSAVGQLEFMDSSGVYVAIFAPTGWLYFTKADAND